MAYKTDMELVGLRDAIRSLNKIEPGLRKQFVADARQIAQPAIDSARRGYVQVPLSGMSRNWRDKTGRLLFPFTVAKAQRGVQLKVDTDRRSDNTISIIQKDQAAAIFETAGRRNPNALERSLGELPPGRTRIIGPAVYRARPLFERELRDSVMRVIKRVQKEFN
jgi:hypothetical protein